MRRFYAAPEQFSGEKVELLVDETRHLRDVLRLSAGDEVTVFDGNGREFSAVIDSVEKISSKLNITKQIEPPSPESPLDLHLAAALLKGDKFDLVVQKAVELGVNRLTPMVTYRTDVKINDPTARVSRWRRIALEACKQSGRARLMYVEEPSSLDVLLGRKQHDRKIIHFSERSGGSFDVAVRNKKITAIVGPEGGWEDSELEMTRAAGVSSVTFGGRILRAETAAIAITAILQHRFGDMN